MQLVDGFVYLCRTSFCIGTEVGVRQHGHYRFLVEETYSLGRQFGNVYQGIGVRMTVNQCIGNEISSLLGVQNMHGTEMFVSRLDTDNFLGNLDRVGVLGVQSGYKGICFAGFHHHHTKVVAFEHLVVCFLEVGSFAGTFFAEDACITFATF